MNSGREIEFKQRKGGALPLPSSPPSARQPSQSLPCEGGVKTKGFDGGRDVMRRFLSPSQRFALPAPSQRGPRNHTSASLFAAAFALKGRAVQLFGLWQDRFSNGGHRTPPPFAALRQRRDLIIACPRWGFPKGRARTPSPFGRSRMGDFQGGRKIETSFPLEWRFWLLLSLLTKVTRRRQKEERISQRVG